MTDLYEVLGVARDATPDDIRRAYRAKAKAAHPDTGGSEEAFQALSRAHAVLSDMERRRVYDETGRVDDAVDNTDAKATVVLDRLVNDWCADDNAKSRDVIAWMKAEVATAKREATDYIETMRGHELRLIDLTGRFEKKPERDILGRMLQSKLEIVRNAIAGAESNIKTLDRAVEMLDGYKFRVETPKPTTMSDYLATAQMQTAARGRFWEGNPYRGGL